MKAVEEDADVEAGTVGEVVLTAGGVEEPVGLQDEAELGGEGDFHAEERGNGHEGILVHGGLRLYDEVPGASLSDDVVLDPAAADEAAYEGVYPALGAADVVHQDAAPAGMGVGGGGSVSDIGTVALGSDAEHVGGSAEGELDVTADTEGCASDLHCPQGLGCSGVEFERTALDVAAVQHHAAGVAAEAEIGAVGSAGGNGIQGCGQQEDCSKCGGQQWSRLHTENLPRR